MGPTACAMYLAGSWDQFTPKFINWSGRCGARGARKDNGGWALETLKDTATLRQRQSLSYLPSTRKTSPHASFTHFVSLGHLHLTGVGTSETPALSQQIRSSSTVDRTVDTTTTQKRLVRSVDDHVNLPCQQRERLRSRSPLRAATARQSRTFSLVMSPAC